MKIARSLILLLVLICGTSFAVRINFEGDILHWFQYDQKAYFDGGLGILVKPKVVVSNAIFEFALNQIRPYDTKLGAAYGVGLDRTGTRFVLNEETTVLGSPVFYNCAIGNVSVNYLPGLVQFGQGTGVPEQLGIHFSGLLLGKTLFDFFWVRPERANEFYWGGKFTSSLRGLNVRGIYADYTKVLLQDNIAVKEFQDSIWSLEVNKRIGDLYHFAIGFSEKDFADASTQVKQNAADASISYMGNRDAILTLSYWDYDSEFHSYFDTTYSVLEADEFSIDSLAWKRGKKGIGFMYNGFSRGSDYKLALHKYENLQTGWNSGAILGEYSRNLGAIMIKVNWGIWQDVESLPKQVINRQQHRERVSLNVPFSFNQMRLLTEYSWCSEGDNYLMFVIKPMGYAPNAEVTAKFMAEKGLIDLFVGTSRNSGFNISYGFEKGNRTIKLRNAFHF